MKRLITPAVLIGLVAIWEVACRGFQIPSYLLPAPSLVVQDLIGFGDGWIEHTRETVLTVIFGFALALVVGLPLAVLIAGSDAAYRSVYPLLVIKQSIPVIAIAPIITVTVGTGMLAKAVVAATVAVFPIVVSTATGLMSTPREHLELARMVRDDKTRTMIHIRLPFAARYIFGGLRVAITLAVIGAIVAEFVSSGRGLGYVVYSSMSYMRTPLAFAALLVLSTIGLTLFALVGAVQNVFFSWTKEMPGNDGSDA